MKGHLKTIVGDAFFRNNAILFFGSFLTAAINYLYHPLLGRLLPVTTFGEVQAALSLSAQFAVITGVFSVIATNLVSNQNAGHRKLETATQMQTYAFYLSVLFASGIVITSPFLSGTLQFHSSLPLIALAAAVAIGAHSSFYLAYFRGIHDFVTVSILSNIQAAGKLGFAVLFILLGWGAFGAVFALFCAGLSALFYAIYKAGKAVRLPLFARPRWNKELKREFGFGVLVLFATGLVTLLSTADVVIVKALFPAEQAGLYSGIATIARIIFFLTSSVAAVLLPSVKLAADDKTNKRLLQKAFLLLILLGGGALGFFSLFPEFTIHLLIGSRYLELAWMLPRLGLLLFLVSAVNLLTMYALALRQFFLIPLSIVCSGILVILLILFHDSPAEIVNSFLASTVVALIGLFFSGLSSQRPERV